MRTIVSGSLFFITGAAIASFVTYKVVGKKFRKIADEEIESVREVYERKIEKIKLEQNKEDEVQLETPAEVDLSKTDGVSHRINPYSSLVSGLGYSKNEKEENEDMADNDIIVIPPEDFGEYGYRCESLTYYNDNVLTFDNDEKITDVNKYVGPIALTSFGEYEDDSVFVRNHDLKTDYEILRDYRRYSDVVGTDD